MIELHYAPGACSFVPHAALEVVKAATGEDFVAHPVKIHKGEHRTPEYLALNPNAQVPTLVVDGKPLSQIVAICDYLDRRYPQVGLLPAGAWERAQAMSQLAWMNNTVHPTFTHVFMPQRFADGDEAQAEVRRYAIAQYRKYLERIEKWASSARPYWFGERIAFHDAYALTLLRWAGFGGIDRDDYPVYTAYVDRVAQCPPIAAVIARERITLDTLKK